ncbi:MULTISPECIES: thiopurine S-methyltransferase [Pseudanabaena]|uniref:Thiopurine S-methyltransferase n=2 Tax=Pseudanabaena TaxID=1152 RepID=L8N5Q7_9CYAN|nr:MULTISPECIES: thiopurine S-methyltransferase [Pseudanabaena]ELS34459.1 Thiopurine S-methyltransferase [Pseudanabaena biceps PCC 7429]MDG3493327.1 thiopurine S-methyltransferase [Pseudanabaena catenata USMAC16]
MDASFWHQKWEKNDIAFHNQEANSLMVKSFKELSLVEGSLVFVPLCGKTLDISWLLSNGYRVAGAELSKIAIEQLFVELGVEPQISKVGELERYSATDIDIFVGDIFLLSSEMLGVVDAIYDRAALVALPEALRNQYTAHLTKITHKAPQLLICYEYDQSSMAGPPFSISNDEVSQHYLDSYNLTLLSSTTVDSGLKEKCAARENVWLLQSN